ncbi:AfsR/SARP family transcriptional regulator [Nocardiopsis sp. N85]|uniref:AfsR/SARP family transcriptional regulator n=1 Tax=Nocardiopsis sp. N85 TaxID=3029400 RepID=UPI00237F9E2B|nr:AfsR/SARP family transcriptional regulator [Nocardiopsis sp. N85]MDE3724928.1 AfsR/SARP family transcriptional regulator [Nocardiopsis sp. N85]
MGLRFTLLGPARVFAGTRELDPGTAKQRALLVALLLRPGRVVPLHELAAALWDGDPPRSAVANLRTYVGRLRRLVASERIVTRHPGYLLRVDPGELDTAVFAARLDAGRRALDTGDLGRAEDELTAALTLWRGAAAEDVPRTLDLAPRLQALEERRRTAAEDLARVRILRGAGPELVGELRASVAADPVRERQWVNLVLALHRAGDIAGALDVCRAAHRALRDHLGVDPGEELVRLHRSLLDRTPPLGLPTVRPPTGPSGPRDEGPVGRGAERATLARLLVPGTAPVVVAVHGPVGVGKSALAARAAAGARWRFPDGHLWVDLGAARPGGTPRSPRDVLADLLRGLGVAPADTPVGTEDRARLLSERGAGLRLLFVLDNAADEAQVRPLIADWPGAGTLITGRRHLGALDRAEHIGLGPLAHADAVALLARTCGIARVRADPRSVARIASFCDHLPLALRIAGLRLRARREWSLRAFADLLADERHRLDVLTCADQSVRAALDTAFAPLRGAARGTERLAAELFGLLGVHAHGAFGPTEVSALSGRDDATATAALGCLADARLIEPSGADRYRLTGLARLYAAELGTRPVVALPHRGARVSLTPRPF